MPSTMPRASRSGAVIFSASAASTFAAGVAPQDRGAALGRNDAVDGELLHQHAVADGDAERAAAAALAGDDDDDRHVEDGHLAQVQRDGLGDAALLGLDAGIGRRRVDEDDDRPAELLGHLHHAQRLAIALRPRVAEVAVIFCFVSRPFWWPMTSTGCAVIAREARRRWRRRRRTAGRRGAR